MEKAKISVIQFFALMLLFELGSELVISHGMDANSDSIRNVCGNRFIFNLLLLISSISEPAIYRLCSANI